MNNSKKSRNERLTTKYRLLSNRMSELVPIRNNTLQEMYERAEPGLDFEDVLKNTKEYPENWYDQHYLSIEEQNAIVQRKVEEHDLNQKEKTALETICILDLGPSSVPPEEK